MAAINLGSWIPEQWDGELVQQYVNECAIQQISSSLGGRLEEMLTDLKHVPKEVNVDANFIAKGATYAADTNGSANLLLNSSKSGVRIDFNEEDIADAASFVTVLPAKQKRAASALALLLDNAVFGVTGTATTEPTMDRPFTSLPQAILTSNQAGQFSTLSRAASLDVQRDVVNEALSYTEQTVWSSDDTIAVCHPAFKPIFRNAPLNGFVGQPMWDQAAGTLFGQPVFWTRGANLTTGAATSTFSNVNPLLYFVPRAQLILGRRAPLEWMYIDPRTGLGALSDTGYLKMRQRSAYITGDGASGSMIQLVA